MTYVKRALINGRLTCFTRFTRLSCVKSTFNKRFTHVAYFPVQPEGYCRFMKEFNVIELGKKIRLVPTANVLVFIELVNIAANQQNVCIFFNRCFQINTKTKDQTLINKHTVSIAEAIHVPYRPQQISKKHNSRKNTLKDTKVKHFLYKVNTN